MNDELNRLTKIAVNMAKRFGVSAAIYANANSFDVLTERWRGNAKTGEKTYDGLYWVKLKTRDAYTAPSATARRIRFEITKVWGNV